MSACSALVGFDDALQTTSRCALFRFGSGSDPGRGGEVHGRSLCAAARATRSSSASPAMGTTEEARRSVMSVLPGCTAREGYSLSASRRTRSAGIVNKKSGVCCAGSAGSGLGQVAVLAPEEEQRAPLARLGVLDLADVDDVVAALERVDDAALDVPERAREDGRAEPAEPELQAGELVPAGGGKAPRDRLLVLGEDVEHEGLRVEEVRVGLGLAVDADQEERGGERERGDRVGREPVRLPALVARGDDGDAGREAPHHLAQLARLGRHPDRLMPAGRTCQRRARLAAGRRRGVTTIDVEIVIDADGHVLEPPDLWERYLEPAYRARAIRVRRGGATASSASAASSTSRRRRPRPPTRPTSWSCPASTARSRAGRRRPAATAAGTTPTTLSRTSSRPPIPTTRTWSASSARRTSRSRARGRARRTS